MRGRYRLLLISLLALLSSACMSRIYFPFMGFVERPAQHSSRDFFNYQRDGRRPAVEPENDRPRTTHDELAISTPSVGYNNQEGNLVTATYYRSRAPGQKRLVVVLPIYGSSRYPSHNIVKRLLSRRSARGTNILWITGERDLVDWPALGAITTEAELAREVGRAVESASNTVVDVRKLLDWAETQPDVDRQRIGIVGFSIGAILSSMVMGSDERIAAGVFVMGGAHFHEILASCGGKAGRPRKRILHTLGWTQEQYERFLVEPLDPIDPVNYVDRIPPRRVLVIDAAIDSCIPEQARLDFWEAMGRPERISLTYGHKVAFLSLTPLGFRYSARRITAFLDEALPVDHP